MSRAPAAFSSVAAPTGSAAVGKAAVRHPAMILAATILASSLSFIDGSVVNVGLPAIGSALQGDAAALQWVINAYLLPLSALLLFGGALGDRFGRRRLLLSGTVIFAAASAACAGAPSLPALVAARVLQGVGAALLMPNSLAILSDSFEGAARGRAVGTWAAVGAVTAGLGPLAGGWLIDVVGWRMIFVVNLPVAAAALLLAWRFVPAGGTVRGLPLDPVGAVLAVAGLALLTFGLVLGAGPGGWTLPTAASLVTGVAVLGGFVLWEHRQGPGAMMPLGLFGSRSFVGLTLLTFLLYGALGALFVLLPFALMRVGEIGAARAGAALVPLIVIMAVLSPMLGGLAGRIGARPLLVGGSAVVALGLLMLLRVDAASRYADGLLPALCLVGLGLAAAVSPLTTAVLASVDPSLTGTASGFNSAVARTGGLLATACLGRALAADGATLVAAGHVAAVAAAAASLAAAACGLLVDADTRHAPRSLNKHGKEPLT